MSTTLKAVLVGLAVGVLAGGAILVLVSVAGDEREPITEVPNGNPDRGRELIADYGCGSCHRIPGVQSTDDWVGPPLEDLAERRFIAGNEPNRPSVLIRWIQDPESIEPGTVMPDLGVSPSEARDIAAYLYGR